MMKIKQTTSVKPSNPTKKFKTENTKVQDKITKEMPQINDVLDANALSTLISSCKEDDSRIRLVDTGGNLTTDNTVEEPPRRTVPTEGNGDEQVVDPVDAPLAREGGCDKLTVEDLSSILLDVGSSLDKAPRRVKRMLVSEMNPPETLKHFVNTVSQLTERTSNVDHSDDPTMEKERFLRKRDYDSDTSLVDTKYFAGKSKYSESSFTDQSTVHRSDGPDVLSRVANIYYENEYEGRRNTRAKRKRLVTERSEYLLLKPNEVKNKIKKVMKKYINSFEKFLEEEINRQNSEVAKTEDRPGGGKVKRTVKAISFGLIIVFVVSVICAVGYTHYYGSSILP